MSSAPRLLLYPALMLSHPTFPALGFAMVSVLLAPCGTDVFSGTPSAQASEGDESLVGAGRESEVALGSQLGETPDAPESPEVSEPAALRRRDLPIVAPLTDAVRAHLRDIAARGDRDDQVFAKMGGSSVESHAYLHCLSRDRDLELGEHTDLRPTLEFFREGRAAGSTPFSRESLVAQVGWSLRQGLTGRPSRALQEVRAINSRWALAFWGGNDVQGRNPRRYVERLLELIESLESRGVVPLLAATTPRGDDEEMDLWARRYNHATRGLAEALALPYLDFYAAINALPGRGLAGDGVHPNVLLDGGRSRPCDFTEEGLERGQNQRNLRTLQLLHEVRRAIGETATGTPADDSAHTRAAAARGTAADAAQLVHVPHGEVVRAHESNLDAYSCEGAPEAPGPERVYRIDVAESLALNFDVYRGNATIVYLGNTPEPTSCVSWARSELSVILTPGTHYVAVEVDGEPNQAPVLVVGEPIL